MRKTGERWDPILTRKRQEGGEWHVNTENLWASEALTADGLGEGGRGRGWVKMPIDGLRGGKGEWDKECGGPGGRGKRRARASSD